MQPTELYPYLKKKNTPFKTHLKPVRVLYKAYTGKHNIDLAVCNALVGNVKLKFTHSRAVIVQCPVYDNKQ